MLCVDRFDCRNHKGIIELQKILKEKVISFIVGKILQKFKSNFFFFFKIFSTKFTNEHVPWKTPRDPKAREAGRLPWDRDRAHLLLEHHQRPLPEDSRKGSLSRYLFEWNLKVLSRERQMVAAWEPRTALDSWQ
jgi:hypothetical protein